MLAACISAALALAACGSSGPAPASRQVSSASGAAALGSSQSWEQVIAAAKQEGKLVVIGPANADVAPVLSQDFEKQYPQIKVDYTGLAGPAVAPKIMTERAAGQYLVDLVLTGGMTTLIDLASQGGLDATQPYITGPEGRDPSKWTGGKFSFADNDERTSLVLALIASPTLTYNPVIVAPGEIKSYKDLLNAKWKNKIALFDPRVPGTGQAAVTFLYTAPGLGRDYLRQLFAQNLNLSRDDRQLVDSVVRGVYPLEISGSQLVAAPLQARGVAVNMLGAADMEEGGWLNATGVGVANRAPHPNAARVYLDYVLSRSGQTAYAKALGYVSARTDVPHDFVSDILVPKPGVKYAETYKESYFRRAGEIRDFITPLFDS